MNRALRRHPLKPTKEGKRAKTPLRPGPRPAPSRAAPSREGRSFLAAPLGWRPRFVMDIVSELRKVTWPSREDTVHLTIVVVIVTITLGAKIGRAHV